MRKLGSAPEQNWERVSTVEKTSLLNWNPGLTLRDGAWADGGNFLTILVSQPDPYSNQWEISISEDGLIYYSEDVSSLEAGKSRAEELLANYYEDGVWD